MPRLVKKLGARWEDLVSVADLVGEEDVIVLFPPALLHIGRLRRPHALLVLLNRHSTLSHINPSDHLMSSHTFKDAFLVSLHFCDKYGGQLEGPL